MPNRYVETRVAINNAKDHLRGKIEQDRENAKRIRMVGVEGMSLTTSLRRIVGLESARQTEEELINSNSFSHHYLDLYHLLLLSDRVPERFTADGYIELQPEFREEDELIVLANAIKANWFVILQTLDMFEAYSK